MGRTDVSAFGFIKFNRNLRAIAELTSDSDVFGDTGLMETSPVNINISEGATPYHVNVARRVPIPLLPKVEDELRRMERADSVVCSDARCAEEAGQGQNMNRPQAAKQGHAEISVSQVLAKLTGSVCFSKMDASGGYWQLALDEESSKLTTFITPLGSFCMTRVPFRISSASEIFQRKMEERASPN